MIRQRILLSVLLSWSPSLPRPPRSSRPVGETSPHLRKDIVGLLYLVNGILSWFVFEAVRRERVVNVAIPLRRVTILGLTLSIPALLLHHEVEYMQQRLAIPNWAWIAIGAGALYLILRLHEGANHLTDCYFDRELDRAERHVAGAILKASIRRRSTTCWPNSHSAC